MTRRIWKWCLGVGLGLLAIGALAYGTNYLGQFLRGQGLSRADQYSSVFSLLVGIAGLLLSLVATVATLIALKEQRTALRASAGTSQTASAVAVVPAQAGDRVAQLKESSLLPADLDRLKYTIAVDHERLFGVDRELSELGRLLSNRNGDRIVSILGAPGLGKTALVYELVVQYAKSAGFARVAAVSAKFSNLDPAGRLDASSRVTIDWRDLLVEIARQLELDVDFSPQTIEKQLPSAMPAVPCLLVIDNLETLQESRVAVQYLTSSGLLGSHKVVLTTRTAVADQVTFPVRERRWVGPDKGAARAYARYLAADDPTLDPREQDLDDVVAAAERVPLLIKIIMKQAVFNRLPIRDVIARLQERGGPLGKDLWSYCYVESLNALSARVGRDAAEQLMSVFCAKPPGSSFTGDELFGLSGIESLGKYEQALAAACNLSLVRSLAGNTIFTVHSLLRQFYCAAVDSGVQPDG